MCIRDSLTDVAILSVLEPIAPTQIVGEPKVVLPFHPNGMLFEGRKAGKVVDSWTIYSMGKQEHIVKKIMESCEHVDLVFGTHNIHHLPQLLKEAYFSKERVVEVLSNQGNITEDLPSLRASDFKAWVNIMYGCNKFCTYCKIGRAHV